MCLRIESREYKLMLNPAAFADPDEGLALLRQGLGGLAQRDPGVAVKGPFGHPSERTIVFLDTPDHALRRAAFVLRRRMEGGKAEYTLKCRSEDRYYAAGADVASSPGFQADEKFEEDIAAPFDCRFSRSNTATPPKGSALRRGESPGTFAEASAIFPALGRKSEGLDLQPRTTIAVVRGFQAHESVFRGSSLIFRDAGPDGGDVASTIALILWTEEGSATPVVAEFSFRVESKRERFGRMLAGSARRYFESLLRLPMALPSGAPTKTAFVYGDSLGD